MSGRRMTITRMIAAIIAIHIHFLELFCCSLASSSCSVPSYEGTRMRDVSLDVVVVDLEIPRYRAFLESRNGVHNLTPSLFLDGPLKKAFAFTAQIKFSIVSSSGFSRVNRFFILLHPRS
ncbi:hypothetical protein F3Y22_tig00112762pilonHSYRG00140 [Hibiscus syriacus]|uniref:Uncharacterized protein n=1 Tax=Hibiscus syriacus TaxID=106335 RepID=A0A6A2XR88_HIBSY|nr:hypothetical protein F3Y22_tig00112762pilonHSYRG00140 [Hibiscus syriacus]